MSFAYTQGVVVLERFCTPFVSLTQTRLQYLLSGTIPYNAKIRIETIS